jgi:hypothetical protein
MINEPIHVLASFREHTVRPLAFVWGQHKYTITKVNLVHRARKGRDTLYFFSVSDDANYFKIRFDTGDMSWELEEVEQH